MGRLFTQAYRRRVVRRWGTPRRRVASLQRSPQAPGRPSSTRGDLPRCSLHLPAPRDLGGVQRDFMTASACPQQLSARCWASVHPRRWGGGGEAGSLGGAWSVTCRPLPAVLTPGFPSGGTVSWEVEKPQGLQATPLSFSVRNDWREAADFSICTRRGLLAWSRALRRSVPAASPCPTELSGRGQGTKAVGPPGGTPPPCSLA